MTDTPPDLKEQLKRVDGAMFEAITNFAYLLDRGLADHVVISIEDGHPQVTLVIDPKKEGDDAETEIFRGDTHWQAFHMASKAARSKLTLHHNSHADCQDWMDALQTAKEALQKPLIVIPSGN